MQDNETEMQTEKKGTAPEGPEHVTEEIRPAG